MPVYEYLCDACGPFSEMRPLAAFAAPCACPGCGMPAGRNLVSAPALGGGASPAPGGATGARHSGGCGCCAPRRGLRAEAVGRGGA